MIRKRIVPLALTALALIGMGNLAKAQNMGTPVCTADSAQSVSNAYLLFTLGCGTNVAGGMGLQTTTNNPNNPNAIILARNVLNPANNAPFTGSFLYVRVDGGGTTTVTSGGFDYVFGDQTHGHWVQEPIVIGNRLVAKWATLPVDVTIGGGGGGTGGGGGGTTMQTLDHQIEIDLVASFVHDTLRCQFTVVNNNTGAGHRVALAFTQDVDNSLTDPTFGAPVRLPAPQPYLRKETLLVGNQVPKFWEVFRQLSPGTPTTLPLLRSIRGTLKPQSITQNDPTPPTRFAYGYVGTLNGFDPTTPRPRNFDLIWNFQPNPNRLLEGPSGANAAITLYWDEQFVAAQQSLPIVTYIGQSTTDNDFAPPMSLSVSGPIALSLTTDRTDPNNVTSGPTPNPFTITAFVQNQTDVQFTTPIDIGPVNLSINLPKGLALDTGETSAKTIPSISPGSEGSVSWKVRVITNDPANQVSGVLNYSVAASSVPLTLAKNVTRNIEIPAPPVIQLKGNTTGQGNFQMISLPLIFNNTPPSTILGLSTSPPNFDLVKFNPSLGHYEPVNTFQPGQGYWFRGLFPADKTVVLDSVLYPPLEGQVQPGAKTFSLSYPAGWNQIGNPYVYGFRFSEIQVFDTQSLQLVDIGTAADTIHQWILPALYRYDTSDPNPQNWGYVLIDNLGFIMQPFEGYWMLVKKNSLQFLYPGTDTPGGSVTRSALVGVGLGSNNGRGAVNNWRLQLTARGTSSSDKAYIGTAPKATDQQDYYKLDKPPMIGPSVVLDIINDQWTGGRFAQDLRSPNVARKTWDLMVRSGKANEEVTLNWADIAASVPRQYRLTLVDIDRNVTKDMRSNASYTVNTGQDAMRRLQVVAEPSRGVRRVQITSFDAVARTRAAGGTAAVDLNYTLTDMADAKFIIRDAGGRSIREISTAPTRAASGGVATGSALWDMRDNRGISLPGGAYQVELNIVTSDGQRSRQIRPILIPR